MIRLWSNLPDEVDAPEIARLYRKRWRIEGMFQRLEWLCQIDGVGTYQYSMSRMPVDY
ncbi:transposase [Paraburkholderia sp. BL6665CI2N2]|uniref:transposase n=1 Tax=unclassified Paraburkholderia TaxID=2615204 RepID=UPI000E27DB61